VQGDRPQEEPYVFIDEDLLKVMNQLTVEDKLLKGDDLVRELGLTKSIIHNGGALKRHEKTPKMFRVQFSGLDQVIDREEPKRYGSPAPENFKRGTPKVSSPLKQQFKEEMNVPPPPPLDPAPTTRYSIVMPVFAVKPVPLKSEQTISVEQAPETSDVFSSNLASPVSDLPSANKGLPHTADARLLDRAAYPTVVSAELSPDKPLPPSRTDSAAAPPQKKKVKRRHIQIQTRIPMQEVGIQVSSFQDMEKEIESLSSDRLRELEEENVRMKSELDQSQKDLKDAKEKLETLSEQAFKKIQLLLEEKQQLMVQLHGRVSEDEEVEEQEHYDGDEYDEEHIVVEDDAVSEEGLC
jgi:hypothetical protein